MTAHALVHEQRRDGLLVRDLRVRRHLERAAVDFARRSFRCLARDDRVQYGGRCTDAAPIRNLPTLRIRNQYFAVARDTERFGDQLRFVHEDRQANPS
jgi:hypothetical protein